jgi:2-polyprenyl-3-methyl-5-hydroxy-6-metoxy-1,4-benzoquinol methylase
MVDLSGRSSEIEIMDDLQISGEVVGQTLKELNTINKLLGGNFVTLRGIQELISRQDNEVKEIRIADMGCGGGDILKQIALWAKRKGIAVKLTGIDANSSIIKYARSNTSEFDNIDYLQLNVFELESVKNEYDIIISTLFLHHFTESECIRLLNSWLKIAKIGVVINDLHRHPFAYYSIKYLTELFSKSSMVKNDGPLSVKRAFSKNDLHRILSNAGISEFTVTWNWAFRWKLVIPGFT